MNGDQQSHMERDSRRRVNWSRVGWHLVGGGVVFLSLFLMRPDRTLAIWILSVSLGILVLIDLARHFSRRGDRLFWRHLGFLAKKKDVKAINASVYYALSLLAIVSVFRIEISMAAVINLAVGDTVAMLVGIHIGRLRLMGKSVEGLLANLAVCLILLYWLLGRWDLALVGALAGSLMEFFSIGRLDDNLTVPVVSGLALWVGYMVL